MGQVDLAGGRVATITILVGLRRAAPVQSLATGPDVAPGPSWWAYGEQLRSGRPGRGPGGHHHHPGGPQTSSSGPVPGHGAGCGARPILVGLWRAAPVGSTWPRGRGGPGWACVCFWDLQSGGKCSILESQPNKTNRADACNVNPALS